jgi:hypothetical protein
MHKLCLLHFATWKSVNFFFFFLKNALASIHMADQLYKVPATWPASEI